MAHRRHGADADYPDQQTILNIGDHLHKRGAIHADRIYISKMMD